MKISRATAWKEHPQLHRGSLRLPGQPQLRGHLPDAFNHPALGYDVSQRVSAACFSLFSILGWAPSQERPAPGQSPSPAVPKPILRPLPCGLGWASPASPCLALSAPLVSVWPALPEGRKREGTSCGVGVHLLRGLCTLSCVLGHLKVLTAVECGVVCLPECYSRS